jgi:hypothetical protein
MASSAMFNAENEITQPIRSQGFTTIHVNTSG